MSVGGRILLAMVAILVVTVAGAMIGSDRWMGRNLEDEFADQILRSTRLVAAALPQDTAQLQEAAHRLGSLAGRRVTIIDSAGRVLGDSEFDDASLGLLDDHSDRPEVIQALSVGVGNSRRFSASTKRVELKVAVRAWPGVVRISAPNAQVEAALSGAQRAVLSAGLAALLLGIVLAILAERAVSRPLRQLATAAKSLAAGTPPVYPKAKAPEVRQLILAFRSMQEHLADRIADLERGREETDTLIESMVEGVIATDDDGKIVVCNSALRLLFDYGPDEPMPNLRELFRHAAAREVVEQVLAGGAVLGREVALDGRTVLLTARPLPTVGAVVCVHDITDLRKLETVRRDFVANVSHELKTPLTSVSGYADTLLNDRPDAETARRFLEVIRTNAQRMQQLVDDLLDLAKLESGGWAPRFEEVDVHDIGQAAWSAFDHRAEDQGVAFEITAETGLQLVADREALRQVLSNLFDNALRHTSQGGRINLEARRLDHGVELAVRDTGSGIPAEHLPRVFERFYRVDPARSRDQGGTGLGLSIVRHLVEAHGGSVHLESAIGRGATVRVSFPSTSQPAAPAL